MQAILLGLIALLGFVLLFGKKEHYVYKAGNTFLGKRILQSLKPYNSIIEYWAKRYNIDPDLVRAIIWQESKGDPYAVNKRTGDYGLMQINLRFASTSARILGLLGLPPGVAQATVRTMLFDPNINVMIGTWLLRDELNYFKDIVKAIHAYRLGRPKVLRGERDWKYVNNVLYFYNSIKKARGA